MLLPVLDIKSTSQELACLSWLLTELKINCKDIDLTWKIAQLVNVAEELNEQFENEFNLPHASCKNNGFYERLLNDDKIEALLSAAFQSAATLDAAIYQEFTPAPDFIDSVKFIRRKTLGLLHEKKDEGKFLS